MIARISLSPVALDDVSRSDSLPEVTALHESLARAIWAHGLLVVAGAEELRELVEAVRRVGAHRPGVRERWSTLIAELEKNHRLTRMSPSPPRPLASIVDIDELRSGWKGHSEVAVLSTEQANRFGVDARGLLRDKESALEVVAAPAAAYCETLTSLRDMADRGLMSAGMPREMFWQQVLRPLAQVSNRVTFLDQYLFNTLRYHHDKRPASSKWPPEVVAWLLTHLDRSSPIGTHVRLIGGTGAPNSPRDSEEAALMIRNQWKPADEGRLASVEVSAGPWVQSERMPHDRHVRFSIGVGLKLHAGFDRLSRITVQDRDGMSWQYLWAAASVQVLKAQEKRVLEGCQTRSVIVLDRASS